MMEDSDERTSVITGELVLDPGPERPGFKEWPMYGVKSRARKMNGDMNEEITGSMDIESGRDTE